MGIEDLAAASLALREQERVCVGAWLALWRHRSGRKQVDVAKQIGIPAPRLSYAERGRVSAATVQAVARALGPVHAPDHEMRDLLRRLEGP